MNRGTDRRQPHPESSIKSRQAALLCLVLAGVSAGMGIVLEIVAQIRSKPISLWFNSAVGFLAAMAFTVGIHAMVLQSKRWSLRARNWLRIGLPTTLLILTFSIVNFFRHDMYVERTADSRLSSTSGGDEKDDVDTSLYKPGWHGEFAQNGVMVVITAFAENALESRLFNQRLTKPVSYASLSVINQSPQPITLPRLQVAIRLDDDTAVMSYPGRQILQAKANANQDLLGRLGEPLTVAPGGMAPDIPICLPPDFPWERVQQVRFTIGEQDWIVAGRIVTAEEKRMLIENAGQTNRRPAATKDQKSSSGTSAESFYESL